jgi:nitrogen fixation-related uncharacterized protein
MNDDHGDMEIMMVVMMVFMVLMIVGLLWWR